ncbi:MAG: M56 family metallopeptidase [Tepidanaerobacteraceae bacterium]
MDKLFLQVLKMSITSSYVILFVIVARIFLKKAPKFFSYALWFIVLFRLIAPFSFESIFSLIPFNTQTVPTNVVYSQISREIRSTGQVTNNSLSGPVAHTNGKPIQLWIELGEIVWLLGMLAILTYSFYTTVELYIKLQNAEHVSKNVYELTGLKTPFVFGITKPKIYLPAGLSNHEKSYIIKHEQTHIKRLDHLAKLLAFIVFSIHWFNPLVWLAFFLMTEDMELSCDESVIRELGSEVKKDYSTSLLMMSTGRRIIGASPLTFGENNVRRRIINILNYKKPRFWVVVIATIAVLTVGFGLITNPRTVPSNSNAEKIQKAETWAEALKTRDGKSRYAIMSENMKEQFVAEQKKRSGEDWNYNIGGSSPWVVDYDIDIHRDTATITYHFADSDGVKYERTEIITFGRENNRLVIISAIEKIAEWDRVNYFAPNAKRAMEVYVEGLLESDYLKLLSLAHEAPFDPAGQDIWDTIKIIDVKVIREDIRENKACYELQLDIEDGGNSAFEKGISTRWLWLVKGEHGWYVEGFMAGGAPDASWWNSESIKK